jgi:hypothetical protein
MSAFARRVGQAFTSMRPMMRFGSRLTQIERQSKD